MERKCIVSAQKSESVHLWHYWEENVIINLFSIRIAKNLALNFCTAYSNPKNQLKMYHFRFSTSVCTYRPIYKMRRRTDFSLWIKQNFKFVHLYNRSEVKTNPLKFRWSAKNIFNAKIIMINVSYIMTLQIRYKRDSRDQYLNCMDKNM